MAHAQRTTGATGAKLTQGATGTTGATGATGATGTTGAGLAALLAHNAATVKGCAALGGTAMPTQAMLAYVQSMGVHPGKGLGIKRWALCQPGQTLYHHKTTAGLCHLDLPFWHKHGLIVLAPCTNAQYAAAVAAWQATQAVAAPAAAPVVAAR